MTRNQEILRRFDDYWKTQPVPKGVTPHDAILLRFQIDMEVVRLMAPALGNKDLAHLVLGTLTRAIMKLLVARAVEKAMNEEQTQ